jgi:hypothetical protein
MEEARQALKKLNVFAQMRPKPTGNAMFSKARLDNTGAEFCRIDDQGVEQVGAGA